MRLSTTLLAALAALACGVPAGSGAFAETRTKPVRVTIHTDQGDFRAELFPEVAPENVRMFLARAAQPAPAPAGAAPGATATPAVAAYAGTQVCETRGSAYVVFGCQPFENTGPKPHAAKLGPQAPDEIDARAMGLGDERLNDMKTVHALWQLEVFPRYTQLSDGGKAVPGGLAHMFDEFLHKGSDAEEMLLGKTRLFYLEAMGFTYHDGLSARRVTKGSLATFTMWPGDADERFLVALDDLTERDGRATVFGRVVEGWDVLDRIQRIPTDKARRPETAVHVTGISIDDDLGRASSAPTGDQ